MAEDLRISVEKTPSESRLNELNIKCWPKWGCSPGKYQLKFDAEETCYLLKGKVKAYTKGSEEYVEFGAGDLVIIPSGLSCTWDVSVAVDKYYNEEEGEGGLEHLQWEEQKQKLKMAKTQKISTPMVELKG